MNRRTIHIIFFTLIIFSCSKKESGNEPVTTKAISIRVLEFGSDLPIQQATLLTKVCDRYDNVFGCVSWKDDSSYSDSHGKAVVLREKFRNYRIKKTGFWSNINEPDISSVFGYINYQPSPTIYHDSNGTLDSLLVKLFPVTTISVRLKNTNSSDPVFFTCHTSFGNAISMQLAKAEKIILRTGIDTTIQYAVFGNAVNHLYVLKNGNPADTLSIQSRFIAKGEALHLEFDY